MIFSGPIFAALRRRSLEFYPNDACIRYKNDVSFDDWTSTGSYVIDKSDKKHLTLRSSLTEFTSVFLGDTENLINHCFEQFVEIQRLSTDTTERSDAWGVVTIYYYAFFAAQALLRLLGNPVMYLDASIMRRLGTLSPSGLMPGAGSFRASLISVVGPTDSEFELTKLDARSHNAVWAELFRILRQQFSLTKQSTEISDQEEIFYGGLCSKVAHRLYVNDEWPARIRHKANYVPGFCYSLVEGNVLAKSKTMVNVWKQAKTEHFHTIVDDQIRNFDNCKDSDFEIHVKLLSNIGHGLFGLVRQLYLDIYDRRNFDKRWEQRRHIFLKKRPALKDYCALFLKS